MNEVRIGEQWHYGDAHVSVIWRAYRVERKQYLAKIDCKNPWVEV